ncbi:MAG: transcriptional regulator, partial [Candidatus Nephrothrix sp. EaCA]
MKPFHETPACALCTHLRNSIFNGLSEEDHHSISHAKACGIYKKGEAVFKEGTRPMGLYCVNSGKIKVSSNSSLGKEYILYISKPGDFLGYRALFGEVFYAATAVALEDSKVCFIPKANFFEVIQKNPTFMSKIVKGICQEMGLLESRLSELAHKSVRERLAGNLLMLRDTYGIEGDNSKSLIDLALSREELASIVGTAT